MRAQWLALLGATALLAGVACGKADEPVPERPSPTPEVTTTREAGTRTVTDMAGRSVLVPDEVRTVVAMSPSAADFAKALGLEIVGRSSDTPEAVAPAAKTTGSTISPDFNAIAALDPDLVIADAAYHSGRTRDFDRFALPVFVLNANSYEGVLKALESLGDAANKADEAKAAIEALKTRAEAVISKAKQNAAGGSAPKVLILTGGGRDVFAGGASSYLGDLVNELGGTNVVAEAAEGGPIAGFGVIDVGQAATLGADVVLILSSGTGGLAEELKSNPAWANSPAVLRGRVSEVDTTLFLRSPGPRVGEALETLFPLLWP
ncbi:MAG: ABC transporter substrate-binding protein [Dehalococcoidia bacterium]